VKKLAGEEFSMTKAPGHDQGPEKRPNKNLTSLKSYFQNFMTAGKRPLKRARAV